jgi:hypothetical protein
MPAAFQYKPKFVDIRVRPPTAKEAAQAQGEQDDVYTLKPGEKVCDHPECRLAGTARAPKSREMLNEHYWFCQGHAAEYNRNWNFFAGMSEGEIRRRQTDELFTGGRPTWDFKASRMSREAAAFGAKFAKGQGGYRDPYNLFGGGGAGAKPAEAPGRRIGKMERNALADLNLDEDADGPRIRARYTELVKMTHPDANGGDRAMEDKLQRVIRAYQALRKAGMV